MNYLQNNNFYLPKDKVYIPQLNVSGIIISVVITMAGTQYEVRYFHDDVPYFTHFFDFEIEPIKPSKVNA